MIFLISFARLGIDQLSIDQFCGTGSDVVHTGDPFGGIVRFHLFGDTLLIRHSMDQLIKHALGAGVDLLQVAFQGIREHHARIDRLLTFSQEAASALTPNSGIFYIRCCYAGDVIITLQFVPNSINFMLTLFHEE